MKINRVSVLKQIKKYVVSVKWSVFALVLTSALAIPTALISPRFFQILIDEVMAQNNMSRFYIVVLGLLGVYLLRFIWDGSSLYFGNRLLNHFTFHLRKDILEKYQKAPYSFLEKHEAGDLKMRLMDDVDCLGNFIREQVVDYVFGILTIVVTLVVTLKIDFKMTLCCLIIVPLVFLINFFIARGTGKINEEIRKVNEEYYTSTHNSLQFWREIKAQNAEQVFVNRFQNFRRILAKLGIRSIRYWGYSEVFKDFKANYLTKVLVYIIGAFFVVKGEISVGVLIMFTEYFALLFSSLDSVNSKRAALKANTPYYKRIFETLTFPEENEEDKEIVSNLQDIIVNNLSFSYREGCETLNNINLTVQKGEYVAIIGKTGCGKTTLAKLLLGLYQPDDGIICFDKHNLSAINKQTLYSQIGIVMQDGFLFNMSIRENLLLSNQEATEEDLIAVCKRANIYDFVTGLENGFDTVIGERGVKLSGGQKQRLAIASVLLKKPKLLIFDKATSSLDKQSEDIINDSIRELAKDITVIVISHKPAAVLRAQKIVVMDKGKITAVGTHDELLRSNPFYKKLAEAECHA